MKVLPFRIPKSEKSALIYQVDKAEQFYTQLHQHEEVQISIILAGEGDLIVGDTVNFFKPHDIFVIGSNIPHLFRNYRQKDQEAHMLTLFFTKKSFGASFFELPEMQSLEPLFRKISRGIRVESKKAEIRALMLQLEHQSTFERFLSFLEIMQLMLIGRTSYLSSFIYQKAYSDNEGERMNKVMNFAISNYQQTISLNQVADLANMTPNAFCRYFKLRTRKTFFQFLLEIRLDVAARLLKSHPERSISSISEAAGFNNMSNFNRKFRESKGMTPTQFRKSD